MAGDLIPPPSPAGRPDPDAGRSQAADPQPRPFADPLAQPPGAEEPVEPPALAPAPAPAAAPPGPSRFHRRFGLLTGVLAGVALAAVAVAVLVAARDDPARRTAPWSAWQPTSSNRLVRAAEIAQHVGRQYRLNDGTQLVDVQAGPLAFNDVPLTPVVRTADPGGDLIPIYGDGIMFVLNGLGDNGSIEAEQPSSRRLALVEREAMELALYTFRYVDDVDHVVALLPPAPDAGGAASSTAASSAGATATDPAASRAAPLSAARPVRTILFRPGDLRAYLQVPLALTFPPASTPRPATLTDAEAAAIGRFTADNVFNGSVRSSQTGQGFLLLDPPPTAPAADAALSATIPKAAPPAKKKGG